MNTLIAYTLCNAHFLKLPSSHSLNITKASYTLQSPECRYKRIIKVHASSSNEQQYELNTNTVKELKKESNGESKIQEDNESKAAPKVLTSAIDKDLKKVTPCFHLSKFYCKDEIFTCRRNALLHNCVRNDLF